MDEGNFAGESSTVIGWRKILEYSRWRLGLTPEGRSRRLLKRSRPGPGKIALDCGANVGDFTEILAAGGAQVHAFEPNPYAFAELQRRFRGCANVVCHQAAVGCATGRLPLFLHESSPKDEVLYSTGSSLLAVKPNVCKERSVEVEVVDLAWFIFGLPQDVEVMKMDIEGAEVEVLEHLVSTGALRRVRRAFVETHEGKMPILAESTARMKSAVAEVAECQVNWSWI